jgi:hypothetical protein
VRTVLVDRIAGGTELPADPSTQPVSYASPALAVDPSGAHAVVIGAGGLVAEVDLRSLVVTYHPSPTRTLARTAKALQGWQRSAIWLPSGRVAVSGADYSATVANGTEHMTETPAGLTLVDTRNWTLTAVDPGVSLLARSGDTLVAFGGGSAGIGIRGYSPAGALRFQLFGTEQIGEAQGVGGLVYAVGCGNRCFRIVDPVSGALGGTAETPLPTQLVGLQP